MEILLALFQPQLVTHGFRLKNASTYIQIGSVFFNLSKNTSELSENRFFFHSGTNLQSGSQSGMFFSHPSLSIDLGQRFESEQYSRL